MILMMLFACSAAHCERVDSYEAPACGAQWAKPFDRVPGVTYEIVCADLPAVEKPCVSPPGAIATNCNRSINKDTHR